MRKLCSRFPRSLEIGPDFLFQGSKEEIEAVRMVYDRTIFCIPLVFKIARENGRRRCTKRALPFQEPLFHDKIVNPRNDLAEIWTVGNLRV